MRSSGASRSGYQSRTPVSASGETDPELTTMSYRLLMSGRELLVEITGRRPQLAVRIDGIAQDVSNSQSLNATSIDGAFELSVDGTSYSGWRCVVGNDVYVRLGGRTFILSRAMDGSAGAS